MEEILRVSKKNRESLGPIKYFPFLAKCLKEGCGWNYKDIVPDANVKDAEANFLTVACLIHEHPESIKITRLKD